MRFAAVVAAVVVGLALAWLTGVPSAGGRSTDQDAPVAAAAPAQQGVGATRIVALAAGFNGFTHTGPDGADPETITVGLADPAALDAIFAFDPGAGGFDVWRPGLAFLNTLTRLDAHGALFLLLNRPTVWEGAAAPYAAGATALVAGFNLVPYLGADGADPTAALAALPSAGDVEAIFWIEPVTQTFAAFRTAGPAILNSLDRLPRYGVLWVVAARATAWPFPAFGGGPVIEEIIPAVIDLGGTGTFVLRGTAFGTAPTLTVGGLPAEATVICEGRAVQGTLPAAAVVGATAVDLTSDGVTVRTPITIGSPDLASLRKALEGTRRLLQDCIPDDGARAGLSANLDAIEAQLNAENFAAAFDAVQAFVGAVEDAGSLAAADRDALRAAGVSLAEGVAFVDPTLFGRLGDLLGGLIIIGIPF